MISDHIKIFFWPTLVFLAVLAVYLPTGNYPSSDSLWSVPLARSVIREGDLGLDEYRPPANDYRVKNVGGRLYSAFPVGAALCALPVVWVHDTLTGWLPAGADGRRPNLADWQLEQITASLIVAAAAVLIFLIARQFLDRTGSLVMTAIFAFGTPAWSTASRALWQHGPSMLLLSLSLYWLLLARSRPRLIAWLGLPLALAYVIRPTNSLSLLILSLYVFLRHRKYFPAFLLGQLAVLAPFFMLNQSIYGQFLPPYFRPERIGSGRHLAEALLGNLVSPARGLLVYCPIFLFSFWGLWLKLRDRTFELLDGLLAAVIVLHWLAVSSFPHWWGGYSYGPRFWSDLVPYGLYFLLPVWPWLTRLRGWPRALAGGAFGGLAFFGILLNGYGAVSWPALSWNTLPDSIDLDPTRLWDWSDPPWLRGLR